MTDTKLRRAWVLIAKIEGDTKRDLIGNLRHLEYLVESDQLSNSVSGGYGSSHIAHLMVDETITHDAYFAELEAHLEKLRAEKEGDPS